jgi:hypothetical protein
MMPRLGDNFFNGTEGPGHLSLCHKSFTRMTLKRIGDSPAIQLVNDSL